MKTSTMKSNKLAIYIFNIFIWITLWGLLSKWLDNNLLLPSPIVSFMTLIELMGTGTFYVNLLATLYRVIVGIFLSALLGIMAAIGSYFIVALREFLRPLMNGLKTIPVMAVIIFVLLWVRAANVPIFVCFLMCFPVVYTNVLEGLDRLNKEFLEMAHVYQVPLKKQILYLYLPGVLSYFNAALNLICGLSWKTVVAAEVLCSPKFSLGYQLLESKVYLNTEELFAWVIAILFLSVIFEKIVRFLINDKMQLSTKRYIHDRS